MAQGSSSNTVKIGGQPVLVDSLEIKDMIAEVIRLLQELLDHTRESK